MGACQVGGDHPFSMGYLQAKPTVSPDGTVSLRYRGGDMCHVGTVRGAARSTRIDFICSASEVCTFSLSVVSSFVNVNN